MVTITERPTRNVVNRRYFPSKGIASEVEGMISDMRRKNIVCERRIEIQRATFSPKIYCPYHFVYIYHALYLCILPESAGK